MISRYIVAKGFTVILADGTATHCGFNDAPTRIQSDEVLDGSKPDRKVVTFTLDQHAAVSSGDVLQYQGGRYRVDRVIRHGVGDEVTTQVAVCDYI